ncbi:hypothetical protein [Oceanitalea stevensii]|uniref:DUF1275 domain-containing protein n=1 Tax=Oceanitalea stevensii TaxID=2763072 RepID=A0ABR8Z5J8_9MICO|nr:hypothetical protein [Oceanitalea stevensii]MBD8063608.1 hypothetical protein [Oceanitalea stevensii]
MGRLRAALLGVAATGAVTAAVEGAPPGGPERWQRTNYAGRQVSLLGGLAQAGGTSLALLGSGRTGAAAAVAAGAAGALGAVDDLTEREADRHVKGLRGHIGALREGQVTTGALKIAGIGGGALLAALVLPARGTGPLARLVHRGTSAALIAGTANLLNLFDLRPGRALKVTCVASAATTLAGGPGAPVAATALGSAAAGLRDDLSERTMLGDTGANALGATLGTALAAHPSRVLRGGALAAVVGLTLLSERVSFSRVIDQTPALHALDQWGRR